MGGALALPVPAAVPMGLGRFRTLATTTSLIGVLSFCVADGKPLLFLLALGTAVVASVLGRGGQPLRLPRPVLNSLVIVSLLYSAVMVGVRTNVISDLTDFLIIVLTLKLLDRTSMRDEAQLLGLSMFVVIGAVLTGAQLSLGLTLVVYMPLMIGCAIVWQVHRGQEWAADIALRAGTPATAVRSAGAASLWQGPLLRVSVLIVVLSLAVAVVGFVVTPRAVLPGGPWGRPSLGAVTGFSDQIRLGAAGLLSESAEPVLDVVLRDDTGQVLPPLPEALYLRGAVLDEYDPRTGVWRRADRARDVRLRAYTGRPGNRQQLEYYSDLVVPDFQNNPAPSPAERGAARTSDDPTTNDDSAAPDEDPAPRRRARTHVNQEITIRNASGNTATPLFSMLRPTEIVFSTSVGRVEYDPEDATLRRHGEAGRLTYTVQAALDYFDDSTARALTSRYLSQRVKDLAAQLRVAADVPPATSPQGQPLEPAVVRRLARQITSHLRANYNYTLEMVAPEGDEDAIDMFLFRTKAGHCEYFASAMVALCSAGGIPARIVTGYVGGEHNPLSGSYLIRASDAHAWVEVQTSPGRWETFDPTPPAELQHNRRASSGIFSKIRQLWEALELTWGNNVIAFEQSSRSTVTTDSGIIDGENLRSVGRALAKVRMAVAGILPSGLLGVMVLVVGLLAVAAAVVTVSRAVFRWLGAAGNRAGRPAGQGVAAPAFYRESIEALKRAGFSKEPATTPKDFALRLAAVDDGIGHAFAAIADRYYAIRFGGQAEAPGDRHLLAVLTDRIRAHKSEVP
jgi:protein-glutamine gamma-glutamyltransferase